MDSEILSDIQREIGEIRTTLVGIDGQNGMRSRIIRLEDLMGRMVSRDELDEHIVTENEWRRNIEARLEQIPEDVSRGIESAYNRIAGKIVRWMLVVVPAALAAKILSDNYRGIWKWLQSLV